jgi:hypothetical protein
MLQFKKIALGRARSPKADFTRHDRNLFPEGVDGVRAVLWLVFLADSKKDFGLGVAKALPEFLVRDSS